MPHSIFLSVSVIVTSATSAFKENPELDDDDDEQQQFNDEPVHVEDTHKHKTKIYDDIKTSNGQQTTTSNNTNNAQQQQQQQQQQQDEWEDFNSSNLKYEQLRLKISNRNPNDNDDEYFDDENDPNNNDDSNEKNPDREQNKDKPVWKTDQIKSETEVAPSVVEEIIDEPKPASTATAGAYRPPHARSGGASVTVVSGGAAQRAGKKKQPNLASTDEFPTLKSTVNKK